MRKTDKGVAYTKPSVETLHAAEIVEALGPVAAGSGFSAAPDDRPEDTCQYTNPMAGNYCG